MEIDQVTRHHLLGQVTRARDELNLAMERVRRQAASFDEKVMHGGPYSARTRNLAQETAELAQRAAAYDAAVEAFETVFPDERAPGVT